MTELKEKLNPVDGIENKQKIQQRENLNNFNNFSKGKKYLFISFYLQEIRNTFFRYTFQDTTMLFKLFYHKYFLNDLYRKINSTNVKKFSDINLQNEMKMKSQEDLIFPTKRLCNEYLLVSDLKSEDDLVKFDVEKKSLDYMQENIKIYKFCWLSNITTIFFFSILIGSCIVFKYHKKNKRLTPLMFSIIATQIIMNVSCLFLNFRTHPNEHLLRQFYANDLEKYKLIYKE